MAESTKIEYVKFVVDETPYAWWDWHLREKNLEFLNGIDADYFRYIAEANRSALKNDDKQRAALLLRLSFTQALETLFSLLCAMVQAPNCVIGWMTSYQNSELNNMVGKISKEQKIYSRLKINPVTWKSLAVLVHSQINLNEQQLKYVPEGFGKVWSLLADDLLRENSGREYNAVKHGLRTRPGGFYLAVGKQDRLGLPASPEKMQTIEGSEFGTSFFTREKMKEDNRVNFRPRPCSINWNPEFLANGLILISVSINNVINYLRITNGVRPDKCNFRIPDSEKIFEELWKFCLAGNGMNIDFQMPDVRLFSKEDIYLSYNNADRNEENDN